MTTDLMWIPAYAALLVGCWFFGSWLGRVGGRWYINRQERKVRKRWVLQVQAGQSSHNLQSYHNAIKTLYRGPIAQRLSANTNMWTTTVWSQSQAGTSLCPPRKPEKVLRDTYIVGYRMWQIGTDAGKPTLRSQAISHEWSVGANTAICMAAQHPDRHEAPHHQCACGLYGVHSVDNPHLLTTREVWTAPVVVGACIYFGRIEVHRDGVRAQYAMPVALLRNGCDHINKLAERYHCACVDSLVELIDVAAGYGATADAHFDWPVHAAQLRQWAVQRPPHDWKGRFTGSS